MVPLWSKVRKELRTLKAQAMVRFVPVLGIPVVCQEIEKEAAESGIAIVSQEIVGLELQSVVEPSQQP